VAGPTPSLTRGARLALAAAALSCVLVAPAGAGAADATKVKVMTRNLYLGADLGPGVRAQNLQELVNAAGTVLNEVDANKFGVRAKGLAKEILNKKPHLVGMQEVALWRTGPCTENPIPPKATKVRYDFLKLLLKRLNKDGPKYHKVVVEPEFDFEIQANTDGDETTSAPGCPLGSEINVRLTMRDAIIARNGVETSNPKGGNFDTLLQVRPSGFPVDVTRGWTRTDAKVPGAAKFRFVNTHLEAFDSAKTGNHTNKGTDVNRGKVRQAQARELFAQGGPATGKLVVLLGDLNSDKKTEVQQGDALAYKALLNNGFKERATSDPLSCCLETSLLTLAGGGKVSDFDHQVDHIMTNAPEKVSLLSSSVTGRKPVNGFWDSDHAGVFSSLGLP
jgi:endonuclease/exonuclease/phosphatase family metal-dependent hydrolase